jgi:hypothetical protein
MSRDLSSQRRVCVALSLFIGLMGCSDDAPEGGNSGAADATSSGSSSTTIDVVGASGGDGASGAPDASFQTCSVTSPQGSASP